MVVIDASFVQGSGIGPVAFIIQASDLHPKNPGNYLDKYADDMYLLVPSVNSHLIPEELKYIVEWAAANNLSLNEKKTAEMVLHKKGTKGFVPPPPLLGITRVESMVILGVTVNDMTFDDHVCRTISLSSQTVCSPCPEISWIGGSCTLGCHACYAGVKDVVCFPSLVGKHNSSS